MKLTGLFRDFTSDTSYALRSMLRAPAFAIAAILTIALGIGVNTTVFDVIHAVLLDPLPYRDPGRLVHVAETRPEFPSFQVTHPDYADWQRLSNSFEEMAAYTFQQTNQWLILGNGEPEVVQVVQASYRLFPMLGVKPLLGRSYSGAEEAAKAPVVLLSESLWRRKYHADPSIVGRTIRLVDMPVTVIGIVGQREAQPAWGEVWMPLSFLDPALTATRRFHALEVVGRLKPDVTVEQAQTEMQGIAARLAEAYPESNGQTGAAVLPLALWSTGDVRPALFIAWGAVSLVLLLACANVAHLVLIRGVQRTREVAVRTALGATSGRLTRFLLTENLVVSAAGGLVGVALAQALVPLLAQLASGEIPRLQSATVSTPALLFAAGATVFCALLFALPAIVYSRRLDIQQVIHQGASHTLSHRRSWFGPAIIAAEIALAFVVMAGAGLLYRSFAAVLDEPTGIDGHGVLTADVPLALEWNSAKLFEDRVASKLREIPGVTAVAAANAGPMTLSGGDLSRFATRFGIAGRTFDPGAFPVAQLRWTSPGYFRALGIPLRGGRVYTEADDGKPAYVINETLAREFFPGQDPVGKQILANVASPTPQAIPIIGVVGDVRDLALDLAPRPTIYTLGVSNRMTVLVRANGSAAALIPAVRQALREAGPNAGIRSIAPLDTIIAVSLRWRRFALTLLGVFAGLAVILTIIGVYGVISYSLSGRASEFAIRYALGAERSHIRRMVLRSYAGPTLAGLGGGAWLAYLFAQAARTQLYKMTPADPKVYGACAATLLLLVFASALRPVAKAASVSPTAIPRE